MNATERSVIVVASPVRDSRLGAYLIVAAAGMLAALVRGRPEPAIAVTPFVVALLLGLRRTSPQSLTVHLDVDRTQVLEGDTVSVGVTVERPTWMRVDLTVTPGRGLAPAPGSDLRWSFTPGRPERQVTVLATSRWGRLPLGTVDLRGRAGFGLLRWVARPVELPSARVLPVAERLHDLLDPAASHASSGAHLARSLVGAGSEFAEIRPYQPGDRLRDLNWAASARRGAPQVNRHHPELGGDVVVVIDASLDSVGDASPAGQEALVRCARAAWSVAVVHLAAQDRVGLLTAGQVTRWLAPQGGARARYELLEALLDVSDVVARRGGPWQRPPEERVPPASLVVGITPLWEDRFALSLGNLARRGRRVAALVLDAKDLLPPIENGNERLARDVFHLGIEDRIVRLQGMGVPTVVWQADPGVGAAIAAVARLSSRPAAVTR